MPIVPLTRSTGPTRAVLRALLDQPDGDTYGYLICQATGMQSGTVMPILGRLKEHGWVRAHRESSASAVSRPPRTYYRLTAAGRREALAFLGLHTDGTQTEQETN